MWCVVSHYSCQMFAQQKFQKIVGKNRSCSHLYLFQPHRSNISVLESQVGIVIHIFMKILHQYVSSQLLSVLSYGRVLSNPIIFACTLVHFL